MAETPGNDPLSPVRQVISEGRLDEALSMLRDIAQSQPDNVEVYCLAGQCLLQVGDVNAALDAFQRAIQVKANWPEPYLGAAAALAVQGDAHGSMRALLHVLEFEPHHRQATRQLLELLHKLRPDRHLPALEPALLQCFSHPEIDPAPIAALCAQQLRLGIGIALDDAEQALAPGLIAKLDDSSLWCLYLSRVISADPQLETLFTRLRRQLCLNFDVEAAAGPAPERLMAALAQQCFMNEYVFYVSRGEADQIASVDEHFDRGHTPSESAARAFALGCMYRRPAIDSAGLSLARALSHEFAWLEDLCRLAVFEPFEEARIAGAIPALGEVHRESSLAVQAQYESNPYPRWQLPPAPAEIDFLDRIRSQFSVRGRAGNSGAARACLLVAGCGTGFEPIDIARHDSNVAVTAIDLSRKSLAYASRQASAIGCDNIEFLQADILNLPTDGPKFDVIVCTGVLHHMADSLAGWRVLRDRLAEGGLMRIGLYSAYARRLVIKAREVIDERKLSPEVGDIREFRQWLLSGAGDSELAVLVESEDFYSMSGCRDLLFHARERQFTLPELKEALDELGLRFCGFDPANVELLHAFSRANPDEDASLDLEAWDRFEKANPDIFAEMYQFWCEPV